MLASATRSSRRGLATIRTQLAKVRAAEPSSSSSAVLAALVERIPVLTPDEPAWETENREQKEAWVAARRSKQYPSQFTEVEEGPSRKTSRLRAERILASDGVRQGTGDASGDTSSLDRELSKRLYLCVRIDGQWQLPQGRWQPPESARDGVLRHLAEACGDGLAVHPVGRAPVAHVPARAEVDGDDGAATFFWRLQLLSGAPQLQPGVERYAWLTAAELGDKLDGEAAAVLAEVCGPHE